MAVNSVEIANSALAKVGAEPISSLTEDVKSAKIINRIYEHVRDDTLRAHPWNFAIKRATLAPNGDTPDSEFDYAYDIPNDCLRVLDTPEYTDIIFVIEDGVILSNESELSIRYIYRNTAEDQWDHCFAEAMAWRLAREVSYALTQSLALFEFCDKKYLAQLAEARSMDGAEGTIQGFEASDWTNARR